ncbi:MAG TPA: glutamyl-tRNA reductase, partial [Nitrospiria bacterium]|nr:glutamyl-tRNA reductase [Nitrospiria bacterium]
MNIIVVGLNHRTAPVAVRERFALPESEWPGALDRLRSAHGVTEGFVLSTCNRVEVCAAVRDTQEGFEGATRFFTAFPGAPGESPVSHLYYYSSADAIRHVFRVAASLDSMVLGEPQILGQVKEAFDAALAHQATGVVLNKLFKKAISVAKRIRTETAVAESAVSVSSAAVELARKIFRRLEDTRVVVMGSGEMAELAAKSLVSHGAERIAIAARNQERVDALAREYAAQAVARDAFLDELVHADIVICSTGAKHYLLDAGQMADVARRRKGRPLFLIDLSVPRNIDPAVNDLEDIFLYNIDDLNSVVEANRREREREAVKAEAIIDEEIEQMLKWLKSLDVTPTIVDLRRRVEELRRVEVERVLARYRGGAESEEALRAALDGVTTALVNKLLHTPLVVLKDEATQTQ